MKDDPVPEELRELSWRRNLTPAEAARLRAWLAAHPEAQSECETEAALTEALDRLPDAPLASNFTARVLQEVERGTASERRNQRWRIWQWRPSWLMRAAVVVVVLVATLISVEQIQSAAKREHLVKGLKEVPAVAEVPRPEILQDFEAIRQLSHPAPDEQLLSLMQ